MYEAEQRAKIAASQGAMLGQGSVPYIQKRTFHIREVQNGWIVTTFSPTGLIGYCDEADRTFVAKTLKEATDYILEKEPTGT